MRVAPFILVLATMAALGWCDPAAAQDPAPADASPLQVIADITLIDSRCHGVTVYYDALFRYGEEHDIATVSILPLGGRRKAFEAAMAWRLAGTTPNELCTDIIQQDDEAAPGVLKRP